MEYNFDEIIERDHTPTEKWSTKRLEKYFGRGDLLSFWVADMDFKAPEPLISDLIKRAEHGVYGYEYKPDSHHEALINWFERRHEWRIKKEHILYSPGILAALAIFINLFSDEGDQIIIQPPVYPPFARVIKNNNRRIMNNPLKKANNKYVMDYEDLEEKISDPKTKMMIISNPHNPVGRVWTKEELIRLGEICLKHNIWLISDEAHADLVYKDNKYTPFASISEEFAKTSITNLSPAKTFNVPGLITAAVIVSNKELYDKYKQFVDRYFLDRNNVFSLVGFESAYNNGDSWLDSLLEYLEENLAYLKEYIEKNMPQIKIVEPEGTYLVWLDFTELEIAGKELGEFLVQEAKIALDPGYWFGEEGADYARINIGCPRSILKEGLRRLESAVKNR